MSMIKAVFAPFKRMFQALRTVSQQTYCGDSEKCEGLSYQKGNLNQDIPERVPNWDSCELPKEAQRAPR